MKPILDPRDGDLEDDASSTHQRSLLSLAGSLFSEISLPKLIVVWFVLLVVPALLLGAVPLLVTAWAILVWSKTANVLTEIWPALLLPPLLAIGWFGGRRLLRLAETNFWSLNALAVQPIYILCREGLRHLVEGPLPSGLHPSWRAAIRAACAAVAGIGVFLLGAGVVALLWPATRWVSRFPDLGSVHGMLPVLLANSVTLITAYCAGAALVWGVGDALMAQPRDLQDFAAAENDERTWRVAHLSDIHTVGERYGGRIESGRAGPRGNDRLRQTLARLDEIHRQQPLDFILITGDLTDAGRSAEWAEFLIAVSAYPHLAERIIAVPGNHDVNVVDRSSPARMDTPMSPTKRLRQLRTLSVLDYLQGRRLRVIRGATPGSLLTDMLRPHASDMTCFADRGAPRRLSRTLEAVWDTVFPMILPPDGPDGLGIVALNSNADTHFSFTNALGLIPAEQVQRLRVATSLYPQACWIVALHHHVIEYPQKAQNLSLRIGTALINGSWVIRQLRCLAGRAVIMHGHRHIDWIGQCGGLAVVSAPSPVMASGAQYFYVHTLAAGANGKLKLRQPQRIRTDEP
ncbi:metallophosphoesterase family protein [Rhodopila globiformis]|uniref:Metallophosphoesterase n=1 Tax=Rhodopila globiformis TaxID=1071 RepID=A0A2S6NH16_RHOGL|nr:metallophosphoesterase [Rhodopila globiformis]PPQ33891.1 metallophosphoesterase [Rhodopila globiformis]